MAKYLVSGEQVRVRTRAYSGALVAPAIWLVLLGGILGLWQGILSRAELPAFMWEYHGLISTSGSIIVLLSLIPTVIKPVIRWLTQVYELTTHRVAYRFGVVSVRRRWMSIQSIAHVRIRQTRRQRYNGCGDIQLFTHQGQSWVLRNIPEIQEFLRLLDQQRYNTALRSGYANAGQEWR